MIAEVIEARGLTQTRMDGVKIPNSPSTPLELPLFCVLQRIKIILSVRRM